jgi:hypothetical protein
VYVPNRLDVEPSDPSVADPTVPVAERIPGGSATIEA